MKLELRDAEQDPVWHKYIQDAINHANNDPLLGSRVAHCSVPFCP